MRIPACTALTALILGNSGLAQAPVATPRELMEAMIIPASNVIFDVGANAPKDAKQWAAVKNNGIILAEAGNLLMLATRPKDSANWMKYSKQMHDAGVAAMKAADAKNVDSLTDKVSDDLLSSCSSCHDQYMIKK